MILKIAEYGKKGVFKTRLVETRYLINGEETKEVTLLSKHRLKYDNFTSLDDFLLNSDSKFELLETKLKFEHKSIPSDLEFLLLSVEMSYRRLDFVEFELCLNRLVSYFNYESFDLYPVLSPNVSLYGELHNIRQGLLKHEPVKQHLEAAIFLFNNRGAD